MLEENTVQNNNVSKVLVIGGGVGGIRAALDLAEAGKHVVLSDKACSIGGLMTQLDRTFPTNNCDLCTVSPHLSETSRKMQLDLMTMTEVTAVAGDAGNFQVTLASKPRYIDLEKCTACGECLKHFPECVKFSPGLDPRAPTCMRYPQVTPYAFSIDMDRCSDVEKLKNICPADAILVDEKEIEQKITFGSIIVAAGGELFDPTMLDNYGGGQYPNVVTGLEYERIMSASGPTSGQLMRPSDQKQPQKVAWIQCVGSRGINKGDVPYCSSVCCMYALKEAVVTKEQFQNDIETVIFYMDMRTSGKDYEKYLQRATRIPGMRLVRCRPHSVVETGEDHDLTIRYAVSEDSDLHEETFDMVVLSTGFRSTPALADLSGKLGIELNTHQFAKTSSFAPVETSRPGIYVCGVFESPKDIPETMTQASAAACMAAGNLPEVQKQETEAESSPPSVDDVPEDMRIGIFICDCGLNIGGVIDVNNLAADVRNLPGVVVSESVGHGCSSEAMAQMAKTVRDERINRVVIGGCSPRTHEKKFQDMIQQAGLNRYLVEIVNIRDQDTWVHMDQPEEAAQKAKELIRMAVSGAHRRQPHSDIYLPINKDVLVVGGGVAGMNAALALADQNYKVFLVEQAAQLGGAAINVRRTLEGEDVQSYMKALIDKVQAHERIEVLTRSIIVDHSGMPGQLVTGLQIGPQFYYREIRHGATVLATGAAANRPKEYLLGDHDAVSTQQELEHLLTDQPETAKALSEVVMIQCVGSRTPDNPNCSRICCQSAVKNALHLLDLNPDARVFILYRDMRTFGFQEDYYLEARRRGVIFVQYDPEDKPEVRANGDRVTVSFLDPVLAMKLEVNADRLVLSTGFAADDEATEDLAMIFHLNRTEDGFFLEDHIKLRPVDLSTPGFVVAGTAHSPKSIRESITQAQAAAGRAMTFLARDQINLGANVAKVDGKLCASCLICVRACPYGVPYINAEGYSQIDPAQCHGCGTCAAECPAKAIQLMQYEDDLISAELKGLLERVG